MAPEVPFLLYFGGKSNLRTDSIKSGRSPPAQADVSIKILATDVRYSHIHWNNVHGKNLASLFALATLAAFSPAIAQNWDSSGNGQLHGTYYFREVVWSVATGSGSSDGTLGEAIAAYGNIVFD